MVSTKARSIFDLPSSISPPFIVSASALAIHLSHRLDRENTAWPKSFQQTRLLRLWCNSGHFVLLLVMSAANVTYTLPDFPSSVLREDSIESGFIGKLQGLKIKSWKVED